MARRLSASRTTRNCMVGLLEPEGDWRARAMHSRMRSSGTGRVRSRRLRTARVVESNWSGSRSSSAMARGPYSYAALTAAPLRRRTAFDALRETQVVTAALDDLVKILDLEPIEVNIFRGVSPEASPQRVFGGQVAGQALVAAARTVSSDRVVHSLHAYFRPPGDGPLPILYEVDRIRDGRSFTT